MCLIIIFWLLGSVWQGSLEQLDHSKPICVPAGKEKDGMSMASILLLFPKLHFCRTLWVQSVCQPAVRRSACPYCHVYFPEFSIFVYDLEVFRLSELARPTRGLGRSMCSISSPIPRSCLILQEGKETCSHLQCDPDMRRCHVPYCAGVKAPRPKVARRARQIRLEKISSKKNSIHKRCLDYS